MSEKKKFYNIVEKAYLVHVRTVYECTYIHTYTHKYVCTCYVFFTNVNLTMSMPCAISFKIPKFYNQLYAIMIV